MSWATHSSSWRTQYYNQKGLKERAEREMAITTEALNRLMMEKLDTKVLEDMVNEKLFNKKVEVETRKYEPKSNTRLRDMDWDEFFDDIPKKQNLQEYLTSKMRQRHRRYNGRPMDSKTLTDMMIDVIVGYDEFKKKETKEEPPVVNWCEIRD